MTVSVCELGKEIKGKTILDGISLDAPGGCVTGLSGVNGSGKTMLMRMIAGLVRPTRGSVTVDGKMLWRDCEFPPSLGLLIENPAFLGGRSGMENLQLLAMIRGVADERRIREVLSYVGLDPDDRRRYSKYSLGMKQRLGLAAAIMERPRVLLLDEPTNALDSSGVEMLGKLVHDACEGGTTVVLACHDKDLLRSLSDQIYYLAEGHLDGHEVLEEGVHHELS